MYKHLYSSLATFDIQLFLPTETC